MRKGFKVSSIFEYLYLSSFLMAFLYIWLGAIQRYLAVGKIEPALWLFFSVPIGYFFLIINKVLLRFKK
jgi:hypothetical protein